MPTLRALECLVAVADTGSVTGAAEALQASQPAVSHQLAALERELAGAVVHRLPRGVVLTSLGRAVLPDARATLAAAERVGRTARTITSGRGGELRIGCAASILVGVLPPVLQRWRSRHPEVTLSVVEADSADDLVTSLAEGALDVAVCPRPSAWGGVTTVIGTEDMLLAMAKDHRLAATTGRVPVRALAGEDAVLYADGHGLASWVGTVLAAHDVQVQVVLRTRQTAAAAQLAAAGLGVAFVPAGAIPSGYGGVVRLLDPPASREIVALTPGPEDPLVQRLIAYLRRGRVPLSAAARSAITAGSPPGSPESSTA